ncbi:MAG: CPBP family intramembrane metalloprotease [Acidobacteria bacterium]|nr:CPBP family intramembrane metalloprotease [Acidobacteriota bacterium]
MGAGWRDIAGQMALSLGAGVGFVLCSFAATMAAYGALYGLRALLVAPSPLDGAIASALGFAIGGSLVTRAFLRAEGLTSLADVGLGWDARGNRMMWSGYALGFLAAGLLAAGLVATGSVRIHVSDSGAPALRDLLFWMAFFVAQSFSEEIMTRGYLLQRLARVFKGWGAIVLTSAIFAAGHMANDGATALSTLNTFLSGIGLGLALWRSGSLWLAVGVHAGWNTMQTLCGAVLSGHAVRISRFEMAAVKPDFWSGGAYGPEASVLATFLLLAAIPALFLIPEKRGRLAAATVRVRN